MDKNDDSNLAKAWIDFTKSKHESDTYEANFWAFQTLSDLSHDDARRALAIISRILSIDNSEAITGMLGAGPLEDLLGIHGPEIIDQIETLASDDLDFVHALKGVWNTGIEPEVWARVSKILDSS